MNMNREQGLFVAALVVLGLFGYLRVSDAYESPRLPRGKTIELAEAPPIAEVMFADRDDPRFDAEGRDVFLPPREWNPLPALGLDAPPLPEIGAVGLIPEPGVEPEHFSVFRRPPPPGAAELAARERARSEAAAADASADDVAASGDEDSRFGGIDFSEQDPAEAVADDASLEKSYDWLKRPNQRRLFGVILNPDKFALLDDPTLQIRFKTINVQTGRELGTAAFERDGLDSAGSFGQGFGFADTVHTRVVLERRRVKPDAGNLRSQIEAARTCLSWHDEDPEAALQGAAEFLRSALSFNPKDAVAWELLGMVREQAFDTEGELKVYDDAREQGVDSARLDTRRALVYVRLHLEGLAETTLEAALKKTPNDFLARREYGRLLMNTDRASAAVEEFERAAQAAGDAQERLEARLDLVRALIRVSRLGEAVTQVERVLRMGIESADAYLLKGTLELMSGQNGAARTAFHNALAIDPTHADSIYNLGVALGLVPDDPASAEQARSRLEEAQDLAPLTAFRSAVARGALEEALGNVEQAVRWFDEGLLFAPGDPFGLYRAGRIARWTGDLERAESLLRQSLEQDGRLVDVLNELGYVALLEDEPRRAEQYLRESLRREPGNRDTHILLGSALLRLNRVPEAQDEFSLGVGDPENPDPAALCGIAWCQYREGAVDDALQSFADARAVSPLPDDPFHVYADGNQVRIDDHRSKEQWIDRFDRKQIKNNWTVLEPFGPLASISPDGGVRFEGMQRPTDPDERTVLKRTLLGADLVLLEARITASARNEGVAGVYLAYEKQRGRGQGWQAYGEVAMGRFPDGTIRVLARSDYDELLLDWWEVPDVKVEADEEVLLTIERTEYERGRFQLRINERVVPFELGELEVRALAKLKKQVVGGLFTSAGSRQNVAVQCDNVRIVRYRN